MLKWLTCSFVELFFFMCYWLGVSVITLRSEVIMHTCNFVRTALDGRNDFLYSDISLLRYQSVCFFTRCKQGWELKIWGMSEIPP